MSGARPKTSNQNSSLTVQNIFASVVENVAENGSCTVQKLFDDLSLRGTSDGLRCFLQNSSESLKNLIDVSPDDFLTVKMTLTLCEDHCSPGECSNDSCDAMHICKFYIIGGNCGRPASKCQFGHDINTRHNRSLLIRYSLNCISFKHLQYAFQQNRQERLTVPSNCKHYNLAAGCRALPDTKCNFMHVCAHYIMGTCKFGQKCKRSHNIFDPQPKALLQRYAVNVEGSQKEVLSELRRLSKFEVVSSAQRSPSPTNHAIQSPGRLRTHSGTSDTGDGNSQICSYNLNEQCSFGKDCRSLHRQLPYQWQLKRPTSLTWEDVNEQANRDLEINYCEPQRNSCFVELISKSLIGKVLYDSMELNTGQDSIPMRRCSTVSSVKALASLVPFATRWKWYWKDLDNMYKEYGQLNIDDATTASLSSKEIEEAYQANEDGKLAFSTKDHKYELDFKTMKQKNMHPSLNTKRKVKRRPAIYIPKDKKMKLGTKDSATDEVKYPAHWAKMNPNDEVITAQLSPSGSTAQEYKQISDLFMKTMRRCSIERIDRIQNLQLWDKFVNKKKWMQKSSPQVEERLLFHGSQKQYIDGICKQGFDWRLSGKSVGTKFGKGSYFHCHSLYSSSYCADCNQMFVVRVLIGKYTEGHSELVRPPPIDDNNPNGDLYDSCVDNYSNPKIFVIFAQEQTYPEYLISYSYNSRKP